jgi:hypothetical protein
MDMAAYRKNTKAQYEALGRFVEAFELMVHEARVDCINMLSYDLPAGKPKLIAIPFYHQVFSAGPLFDVFRAVLREIIDDPQYQTKHDLTKSHVEQFSGVLKAIATEYETLSNKRNNLLHGTWFVGYRGHDNPNAESFQVRKYATSADGLVAKDLPTTAPELDVLRIRCEETRTWIGTVYGCLPTSNVSLSIENCFKRNGKDWERILPTPHKFPKKST